MTRRPAPPVHVVAVDAPRHGVSLLVAQLAAELGAATCDLADVEALPMGRPVHVHFTDRLFGASPAEAAQRVAAVAARRRTTLTLHDVPQPTDGDSFEGRRGAYARLLRDAHGWATSSHAEQETVAAHCSPARPGVVVPLPVVRRPVAPAATAVQPDHSVGVFGWVYPGKGHLLALQAAALLGATSQERPVVRGLGAVSPGHDHLVGELREAARDLGVRWELTGWLDDDSADAWLARTGVGLVAHANLSASASLNSWLAAGRRPLVRDSAYALEMAALRPGTLEVFPAGATPAELAEQLRPRLEDPSSGRIGDGDLVPTPAQAASAYAAWWATGESRR